VPIYDKIATMGKNRINLPVISKETLDAAYHVYAGPKWGARLNEVKQKLFEDNPNLVEFLERHAGKYPKELHNVLFEIAVGTIAIIELQAMVDDKKHPSGSEEHAELTDKEIDDVIRTLEILKSIQTKEQFEFTEKRFGDFLQQIKTLAYHYRHCDMCDYRRRTKIYNKTNQKVEEE
jgi:hypothetical protein